MGFKEIERIAIPNQLLTLEHIRGSLEDENAKIMVKSS
jgi:hypothetical protein